METLDLTAPGEAPGEHAVRRSAAPARRRARADALARGCCSWTSRRPGWTRRTGPTSGSTSTGSRERQQTTIVLTTHYLEEADAQAERVLVIDHGEIIADDTAAEPQGHAGRRPDHGDGRRPTDADAAAPIMAAAGPRADPHAASAGARSWSARFEQGRQAAAGAAARARCSAGVEVRAADVRVPTLDDVFLSLTGRSLREEVEVAAA